MNAKRKGSGKSSAEASDKTAPRGLPVALQEMMAVNHWVIWRSEKSKTGKPTKVPYQVQHPGRLARNNDPATWGSYATAVATATKVKASGIGFCLMDTVFAAFDIDDCRNPDTGAVASWAADLVKRANSYAEITPSKMGLRIIGFGTREEQHIQRAVPSAPGVTCEIYRRATRYITMTGDVYRDAPLANIDAVIDEVAAELGPKGGGKESVPGKRTERPFAPRKLPQELRLMLDLQGSGPAGYSSRSELFFAFIHAALRKGIDENNIVDLCQDEQYKGRSIYEHVADNRGSRYVQRQLEKALNAEGEPVNGKRPLPIIRLTDQSYADIVDAMQNALLAAGRPVYVRGGKLTEPIWRWEEDSNHNSSRLDFKLLPLNVSRLTYMLTKHAAIFQRFHGNRWVTVSHPNESFVGGLLERSEWKFKSVRGVTGTPTMRPDGSIVSEPGYDEQTKLVYKPFGIELPPIADQPNRADAEQALTKLKGLIAECAFRTDVHRSVALAAMMTVCLRAAFPVAPLFFISKPDAGSGASYLTAIISSLATGRPAVPLIVSPDPKELQKEISAAAYEAKPILNLNNLTFDLESALLCQMLTEGEVDVRPFGRNTETVRCDCSAITVIANGNNVSPVGDLVRRSVTIRLDTGLSQPETRSYKSDPLAALGNDRGGYLAAIFTIARAYMAAGCPPQVKALKIASFEQWSRHIQQPLIWLGEPDPFLSQQEVRAIDPSRAAFRERINALRKAFAIGERFTAADVMAKADMSDRGKGLWPAYSRDGRTLNTKSIGRQLRNDVDRPIDGIKINLVKEDDKSSHIYAVVVVDAEPIQTTR